MDKLTREEIAEGNRLFFADILTHANETQAIMLFMIGLDYDGHILTFRHPSTDVASTEEIVEILNNVIQSIRKDTPTLIGDEG